MDGVLRACAVDPDGVLKRNADTVYRLAYSRTRKTADAEDIFQEVFLRYARSAPQFESEEHERAWLIRVTLNCISGMYSRAERKRAISMETLPEDASAKGADDDFELLLLAVPESLRVDLHLFYAERMSTGEIAKLTGRTEAAVRVRLTRARNALRDSFDSGPNAEGNAKKDRPTSGKAPKPARKKPEPRQTANTKGGDAE